MENNIDVIASLANYILNQHATANALAEAIKDEPDRLEDYHELMGAMTAWYYTMEAITHYVGVLTEQEEAQDEQGKGSTEPSVELSGELLSQDGRDDA